MKTHKWPKELLIIRHGQSERNVNKDKAKTQGEKVDYSAGVRDQDTPLTSFGYHQAEETGRFLREHIKIDTFLVSPYLRTRQTHERLIHQLGYPAGFVVEERVREIDFGILDGLTPEGIKVKYPEEVIRRAREGKYYYRPAGGENRPDVRMRCRSILGTLIQDYTGKRVCIVCHSVVVLAFRSLIERWGEAEYLAVDKEQDVLNCGITWYKRNSATKRLNLVNYNLTSYTHSGFLNQAAGK